MKGAIYQIAFSFAFLEQRLPDGDPVPDLVAIPHWRFKFIGGE